MDVGAASYQMGARRPQEIKLGGIFDIPMENIKGGEVTSRCKQLGSVGGFRSGRGL